MKKLLLFISIVSFGQIAGVAVLYIKNSSTRQKPIEVTVYSNSDQKEITVPLDGRFYTVNFGEHPITSISWKEVSNEGTTKKNEYSVPLSIGVKSNGRCEILTAGYYKYNKGDSKKAKEIGHRESDIY